MNIQAQELSSTIIKFLEGHGAVHLLPDVLSELEDYCDLHVRKENVAVVTTTAPLSEAESDNLQNELKGIFGRDLSLEFVLDESIIGGLMIQVGDIVIDRTLKSKLTEVRKALMN